MDSIPDILSLASQWWHQQQPLLLTIWLLLVQYAPYASGTILPPVIQLLNHNKVNEETRVWVSVCVCLFVALLFEWNTFRLSGNFSLNGFLTFFSFIIAGSHLIFKLYFKNSKSRDRIQIILNDYLPKVLKVLEFLVAMQMKKITIVKLPEPITSPKGSNIQTTIDNETEEGTTKTTTAE